MDQVERLARTVAEQRTGSEESWRQFVATVEEAIRDADKLEGSTPRDFLDIDPDFERQPGERGLTAV